MLTTDVIRGVAWEKGHPVLMARLAIDVIGTLTNILQSHITSITAKVFDRGTQIGATITMVKTSVVYNTLQTGTTWTTITNDTTGFNFRYQIDGATYILEGKREYRAEVYVTLTGGEVFPVVFVIETKSLVGL